MKKADLITHLEADEHLVTLLKGARDDMARMGQVSIGRKFQQCLGLAVELRNDTKRLIESMDTWGKRKAKAEEKVA